MSFSSPKAISASLDMGPLGVSWGSRKHQLMGALGVRRFGVQGVGCRGQGLGLKGKEYALEILGFRGCGCAALVLQVAFAT